MRVYKKLEELKTCGLITKEDYEIAKNINTRKKYFSTIIRELIELYNENRLYQALTGADRTKTLSALCKVKSRNKVLEDLNRYFQKYRKKLKLNLLEVRDDNDLAIKDAFYTANAIVIDFETTNITINRDVDIIIFSALDTKTDEYIFNDSERLIQILDKRLVVAHNVRFDFNCIKTLLEKHGYYLHNNYDIIASKSKTILDCLIFKHKDNEQKMIKFYTYDTYNVFPFSLQVIAKLFLDFKKVYNYKYSDVIKEKGVVIEMDKNKVDMTKIDFVHVIVDEQGDKITLKAKTDYGVKQIVEAIGQDLRTSELYKSYNKNDVYLTAVAFMFFDLYYKHVFRTLNFNLDVKRKFTIAGISYDILLQLCKQNVIDMLHGGELELLEHDIVNPKRFEKIVTHAKKCDENIYTLKNNIFYIDRDNKNIYKIHTPYLSRAFKKAYKGGIVYFSDVDTHTTTADTTILQFDINSSYPSAMTYLEINPYARVFKVAPHKIDAFIEKYKCHFRLVNNKKIREILNELNIYDLYITKKYKSFISLIELALNGSISVILRGNLINVGDSLYGINKKFKVCGKEFTANFYGEIRKNNCLVSLYDVIRANMDVDIKMLYITVNKNRLLHNFISKTYIMRYDLKKQKNSFEIALKLLMNSMYGKLGSCIDDVRRYYVCNTRFDTVSVLPFSIVFKSLQEFLNKSQYNTLISAVKNGQFEGVLDRNYTFKLENTTSMSKLILKSKNKIKTFLYTANVHKIMLTITTKKRYLTNNNVFMASQITAFGRLLLYAYAKIMQKRHAKLLYSDTDSLTCFAPKTAKYADITGHDLGMLKLERQATMFKAVKKKFYMIDSVKKAKGIGRDIVEKLDFNNIDAVLVNRICSKYEKGIIKTVKLQITEYKEVAGCIDIKYLYDVKNAIITAGHKVSV